MYQLSLNRTFVAVILPYFTLKTTRLAPLRAILATGLGRFFPSQHRLGHGSACVLAEFVPCWNQDFFECWTTLNLLGCTRHIDIYRHDVWCDILFAPRDVWILLHNMHRLVPCHPRLSSCMTVRPLLRLKSMRTWKVGSRSAPAVARPPFVPRLGRNCQSRVFKSCCMQYAVHILSF